MLHGSPHFLWELVVELEITKIIHSVYSFNGQTLNRDVKEPREETASERAMVHVAEARRLFAVSHALSSTLLTCPSRSSLLARDICSAMHAHGFLEAGHF